MKKKEIIIASCLFIILICVIFGYFFARKDNIKTNNVNNEIDNYKDTRKLLKLYHYLDKPSVYNLGADASTIDINVKIDINKYKESNIKKSYDGKLEDITKLIKDKINIDIDNNWKYYIHYLDENQSYGFIVFIYYINDAISTNRAVSLTIQDGTIISLSYSYINDYLDEELIKLKYNYFINHYVQERKVIDKYKDYYAIEEDRTNYSYCFGNKKLTYSYNIFYRNLDLNVIDNDYGYEDYIEPKLINDIYNSSKIEVKDYNNNHISNISDNSIIKNIAKLFSNTKFASDDYIKITSDYKYNLYLYDYNDKLINVISVWNNGCLGYNGVTEDHLDNSDKNILFNYIER